MISDQYKAIFVHIPRVAGTSIELAITGVDWWNTLHLPGILMAQMPETEDNQKVSADPFKLLEKLARFQPKHRSSEDICLYHSHLWGQYFSFAFTRNPWDRLLSLYASLDGVLKGCKVEGSAWWPWQKFVIACFEDRNYLDANGEMVSFSSFVRCYRPMPWETQHKTQARFLQPHKGFSKLDFIGRFENLEEDFDFVCKKIGFPAATLGKGNASRRGPYRDYYDSATRDFVAQQYAEDIETFNYTF